jgi:hypothetical protein
MRPRHLEHDLFGCLARLHRIRSVSAIGEMSSGQVCLPGTSDTSVDGNAHLRLVLMALANQSLPLVFPTIEPQHRDILHQQDVRQYLLNAAVSKANHQDLPALRDCPQRQIECIAADRVRRTSAPFGARSQIASNAPSEGNSTVPFAPCAWATPGFAGVDAVAMIRAPIALPGSTATGPTPQAAPITGPNPVADADPGGPRRQFQSDLGDFGARAERGRGGGAGNGRW